MTTEKQQLITGQWEGKYLDVRGYSCLVSFKLESEGEVVKGEFEIQVPQGLHDSHTIKGQVSGQLRDNKLSLELEIGKLKEGLKYQAELSDAGSHATLAMMGTVHSPSKSDFGGGVWIAWKFKNQN
ncbi:hypothetical protein [Salinimicrobium sediminilitoris]|uniref:hypothetical protein n=1 Tax=Salinimicrobium sediminilitoris TaxID=2876715 RepID=UPI001E608897|nr:hypothetical protein [Salinimicrobium sediminilitoris]MCC8358381.1 hypothetical protein [Salinimicrobium sediminilitoris]